MARNREDFFERVLKLSPPGAGI